MTETDIEAAMTAAIYRAASGDSPAPLESHVTALVEVYRAMGKAAATVALANPTPAREGALLAAALDQNAAMRQRITLIDEGVVRLAKVLIGDGVLPAGDYPGAEAMLAYLAAHGAVRALGPLLYAQAMGAQVDTPTFLEWMADRLVGYYGAKPHVDYVLSLRARAAVGKAALATAREPMPTMPQPTTVRSPA